LTDYAADAAKLIAGNTTTKRTGTASADTVPGGSVVVWVNTGAGTHVVTLTTNNTPYGLALADQPSPSRRPRRRSVHPRRTGPTRSNRVAVAIDGTAAEVTYYVLGSL
jgi:hypothetical protein